MGDGDRLGTEAEEEELLGDSSSVTCWESGDGCPRCKGNQRSSDLLGKWGYPRCQCQRSSDLLG